MGKRKEYDGFVPIYRKIKEWQHYKDLNTKAVFLHLLLSANYKDVNADGMIIYAGQVVIGRKILANELGLSERQVRTSLSKLVGSGEIIIESTTKFSIISLTKWNDYQQATNKTTNAAHRGSMETSDSAPTKRPTLFGNDLNKTNFQGVSTNKSTNAALTLPKDISEQRPTNQPTVSGTILNNVQSTNAEPTDSKDTSELQPTEEVSEMPSKIATNASLTLPKESSDQRPQTKRVDIKKDDSLNSKVKTLNSEEEEEEKEKENVIKEKVAADKKPSEEYTKFLAWSKENAPRTLEMKKPITEDELAKLKQHHTAWQIMDMLLRMENHAHLHKKYVSAYLTASGWLKNEEKQMAANGVAKPAIASNVIVSPYAEPRDRDNTVASNQYGETARQRFHREQSYAKMVKQFIKEEEFRATYPYYPY